MSVTGSQFKALPIEDLIGAPLVAAAQAQGKLAGVTVDFIKAIGLNNSAEEGASPQYEAVSVDFTYTSSDGDETSLKVPLLSIINIPSLSVKTTKVEFEMTVNTSTKNTTSTESSAELKAKAGWGWGSASFKGSVSKSKFNSRETDTSAKYSVTVEARDDGYPEGLAKVLDILNESINTSSTA